ncbi:SMI1/KNR4 family protein [Actinoplanes sp. NPDC049802]|uniref:SMI1/KNR4 family protein n=1 Tax=Actinoplanes sp. NPDC049802 TaxID=3154742 RepID=UPI0034007FCC
MIAATSADADWRIALAALAAASEAPVAAVVLGATLPDDDPARRFLAGVLEVTGAAEMALDRVRDLAESMSRSYRMVLISSDAGLLLPVGEGGWTLVDLAVAMGAPAVVVTGPGPDAAHHTSLVIDALHGRNLSAAVVTIGDVDESALPLPPVGRIPAAAPESAAPEDDAPEGDAPEDDGEPADRFAGAAEWFEPIPREGSHPATPPVDPEPGAGPKPVDGRRFVLGLLGVFAVMVLLACGLGWCGSQPATYSVDIEQTNRIEPTLRPYTGQPRQAIPSAYSPRPRRSSTDACPENMGRVGPARPGAATTGRVNRAWKRIENWLARKAPASARGLRPPADREKLDESQRRMSVAFPADLAASLLRHDGADRFDLPPFFRPMSLDEILSDWRGTCTVLAGDGASWAPGSWWHPRFVPFAAAGDGGCLLVDQRPGGHGRVGEFYSESGTGFDEWPASVAELLERTATSLETGRPYAGRYRPTVDAAGLLEWKTV